MSRRPDIPGAPSGRLGRYDLLRPLGKGGMAEVFLARYAGPEGFEKRLVIKRVLPKLSDDPRLVRMFLEEAKTQVSFSHGNLVSVFDFGRVGNDYFIAMEYVPGVDLASLLAAARAGGESLPAALVALLGIELCRALGYVHRRGFVHRDVSPRNVLLSVDGEVKLSDFGLALAVESADRPGIRGTPSYMAPEQARGERVDARADLYALGMVLAEATQGADDGPLGAVVARATRPEASDRFGGADEMLAALEQELVRLGVTRESVVRELASKVAALGPAADAESAELAPRPATLPTAAGEGSGRASYFRDHRSETFVDEVLGGARSASRGRSAAFVWAPITIAVALAIGLVAVGIARREPPQAELGVEVRHEIERKQQSANAPVALPGPKPEGASRAVAAGPRRQGRPKGGGEGRTPREQGAVPEASRLPVPRGSLTIRCTPWCIPYLDGEVRGADGRSFLLPDLVPGPHRIEGRRLEDRQERTVEIRPGEHETVELRFE